MLRAVRPSATGVRPVPRSIVRRYAKQGDAAAPSGAKGADKGAAKAPAGGAPASAPKAGAGGAAKESKSQAASSSAPAADLKKQAPSAQAPAAEGKKSAPEKKEGSAAPAKGDKAETSARRDDKSETAVPGGKQRSEGRGDVKSGAKGGKDAAGKGKDKDKDEAADANESDTAKAKRERRAAKKAQLKEEEDEEEEVEEIPVDETEAEGEFVPPKAEPMTPLEAEEVLRRANANAERGSNLLKAEKYDEAEALIQAAFYQYKGLVPEHHPRMLKVTMELAFVYQVHGRKDAALALYDRGTKHWASMLGAQSKEYGSLLANWAELLGTIGKHAEAEAKCQEALAVLSSQLPADHEILGGLVANLAAYQAAQSKWDDAYASSTRALKMLEKSLGAGHDYTIFCLENLLKLLNDQGKTDTVEELKLIWQQKTKRPFRVLSQADVDKLMPTDEDMAKLPDQPMAPSTPRSKSFTPPGKMVTPEAFAAEMTAFWKKVQEKGLDTNPAMQNVVLDDLVRARVISPQEREALLQRKRDQLSQLIMQKISSFTPEQTKHMVKQYIQVQEAAEEVSNWDGQGITVDVFDVDSATASEAGGKAAQRKQ